MRDAVGARLLTLTLRELFVWRFMQTVRSLAVVVVVHLSSFMLFMWRFMQTISSMGLVLAGEICYQMSLLSRGCHCKPVHIVNTCSRSGMIHQ